MAITETSICNSALVKVGSPKIDALTDDNKRARLCALQYPVIRDELLEGHPWNFALVRIASSALSTTPIKVTPLQDFTFEHQLPNDFLRMVLTDIPFPENWVIEGDKLLTFTDTVNFKYIAQVSDTSKYSKTFAEALAAKLAFDISYSLAQTVTLSQQLFELSERKLREARSYDAQGGQQVLQVEANEWFDSRN